MMKQMFKGSKEKYVSCIVKDRFFDEFVGMGFVYSIDELNDIKAPKKSKKLSDKNPPNLNQREQS